MGPWVGRASGTGPVDSPAFGIMDLEARSARPSVGRPPRACSLSLRLQAGWPALRRRRRSGRARGEGPLAARSGTPPSPCDANQVHSSYLRTASGIDATSYEDCRLDPDGNALCSPGGCGVSYCVDSAGSFATCSGTALSACSNGRLHRTDCAGRGLSCYQPAGGEALCVESTSPCAGGPFWCEGSAIASCYGDFQPMRFDCAYVGMACDDSEGGFAHCGAPFAAPPCTFTGADFDAAQCPGPVGCEPGAVQCDGSIARLCTGGAWLDFDCAEMAGGQCYQIGQVDIRCVAPNWP